MTGDGSFDAEKLGEDAGVDELADGIEEAFAERWDARREAMGEEAFGELCRRALLRSLDQVLGGPPQAGRGPSRPGTARPARGVQEGGARLLRGPRKGDLRRLPADYAAARGRGGVRADEIAPGEGNLSYSRSGESTIQDDSDLSAMADIAGEADIEADD